MWLPLLPSVSSDEQRHPQAPSVPVAVLFSLALESLCSWQNLYTEHLGQLWKSVLLLQRAYRPPLFLSAFTMESELTGQWSPAPGPASSPSRPPAESPQGPHLLCERAEPVLSSLPLHVCLLSVASSLPEFPLVQGSAQIPLLKAAFLGYLARHRPRHPLTPTLLPSHCHFPAPGLVPRLFHGTV